MSRERGRELGAAPRSGDAPSPADEPVIVVSGLPRSGTSVVMQMLAAADVPLLVDDARGPDESNPRGYLELAAVKAIHRSTAFLDGAGGRAVKVVAPLLPALPRERAYRVLFVDRRLEEVVKSQAAMLRRMGSSAAPTDDARLVPAFERAIERAVDWAETAEDVALLRLDHARLISRPLASARRILRFLGSTDEAAEAMARVVDPALHRSG